jgi:hypothetical protein
VVGVPRVAVVSTEHQRLLGRDRLESRLLNLPVAQLDEELGHSWRDADRAEAVGGLRRVLEVGRAADLDQHAADRQQPTFQVEVDPAQAKELGASESSRGCQRP